MFLVRVLVGEFTKGSSEYLRPPTKPGYVHLYDSCVDDEGNPSLFVVFERDQMYPEYIIEYVHLVNQANVRTFNLHSHMHTPIPKSILKIPTAITSQMYHPTVTATQPTGQITPPPTPSIRIRSLALHKEATQTQTNYYNQTATHTRINHSPMRISQMYPPTATNMHTTRTPPPFIRTRCQPLMAGTTTTFVRTHYFAVSKETVKNLTTVPSTNHGQKSNQCIIL